MNRLLLLFVLLLYGSAILSAQCLPDTEPPYVEVADHPPISLLPNCMYALWTADITATVTDNCTNSDQIQLGIRRAGAGTGFPTMPDGSPQTVVIFDGCSLGTQFIEFWARDLAGNSAVDTFWVIVQDNMGFCDCFGHFLKSCAFRPNGDPVDEVTWTSIWSYPSIPEDTSWQISGCADIYLPIYSPFTLTPTKGHNPLEGVSTFDIVLIAKHILAADTLDDPYKKIAADVNRSRSITTFDIVELRKLILGIYLDLPYNASWRFIPKSYTFPDPFNPFFEVFPESITDTMMYMEIREDFVAVKVGDVNGYFTGLPEDRGTLSLHIPDALFQPGKTIRIPVQVDAATTLLGLQFALEYDPDVIEITALAFGENLETSAPGTFYAQPGPGLLTLSWNDPDTRHLERNEPLLFLEVRARQATLLSQALRFQTDRLHPELYTSDGAVYTLQLAFDPVAPVTHTQIFPAAPNPTRGPVWIPVRLVENAPVLLEVFDLNGRVLYHQEQSFPAGLHLLEVPEAIWQGQNNILAYRVAAGDQVATGKVLLF
ncbi:MAG: hypothetical protein EP344_16380 [Bacteroidetes bacterium]|nr:MAG: hypothetical protein EP344_16380 [Bacteroidota bacterium]